jgi:hypothetical protein
LHKTNRLAKSIIMMTNKGGHMKKLSSLVATLSILLASVATGSVALADSKCDIGFTGPDSNNICTSTTTFKCEVTNDNEIVFKNDNDQTVATGTATTSDNNSGGSATTGSATNENGTTFTGTVTNENDCVAVVTKPAVVTPAGGAGAAAPAPVTPVTPAGGAGAAAPAVLPDTATESPLLSALVLAGIVGAVGAAARLAVIAYGRFQA